MRRFTATFVAQCVLVAGVLSGVPLRASHAQSVALADRGPRFLWTPSGGAELVVVDASRSALLRRVVSLKLEQPTVGKLLAEIEAQTGLKFVYSRSVVPVDRRIGLRAESITIAAALTEILLDANVDVVLSSDGQLTFVRRTKRLGPQPTGVLVGRVTDVKTGDGLAGADVSLEGTRLRAATGEKGFYRIIDVPPATYTLSVRRVGYARQDRAIVVIQDQELTVDLALQQVVTKLDELVTTVTGDQRRRELGHAVGRINADSIVKEAPIATLSELLTGRVSGVQVFQSQGSVGGDVHIRIRGANSIQLGTEPIFVVDGVRYTSTAPAGFAGYGASDVERTSPFNDINPNDIEAIEIVKGPSAATLYGTDASNGVVIITTKRGRAGAPRWGGYAKGTTSSIPLSRLPDVYWGWQTIGGVPSYTSSCRLTSIAAGACIQDSVTVLPTALEDPDLSIMRSAPTREYGANVSGGRPELRYYFGVDAQDAVGPVQMPRIVADSLALARGVDEIPEEQRKPNATSKLTLRTNVSATFSDKAELHVRGGYVHSNTRALPTGTNSRPYGYNSAFGRRPLAPYGTGSGSPANAFAGTSNELTDRLLGSTQTQWRVTPWLVTRATVGIDFSNRDRTSLLRNGEAPRSDFPTGVVTEDHARQVTSTMDLGATATLRRGRLSARTSVGGQYTRTLSDALTVGVTDLPPGGNSIQDGASTVWQGQTYNESITLGSYVEEMIGLNERLFITGALRGDGASSFGQNYDIAFYPKISASWLVSEEPFFPQLAWMSELRLRYAYGASGQQPQQNWNHLTFQRRVAILNGANTSIVGVNSLGNPGIRPEAVREHEIGFDADLLSSRLQLGMTWYKRRTKDQIISQSLPTGYGYINANLGVTTQHGYEVEVTGRILDTRALSFDVTIQHALHRTKLIDLGTANSSPYWGGGYVKGYPLGARHDPYPIVAYSDANGDGIITFSEIQLGDTPVYLGESVPPVSQTLAATVGVFGRQVRLSTVLERRAGFIQSDALRSYQCLSGACRARVDPTSSLADQAQAVRAGSMAYGFFSSGNFTRLRELTLGVDLPSTITRALRVRSATVSVSGRNLALWTAYEGPDPESVFVPNYAGAGGEADGIPQARSWTVRFDLGL